jgi:hypothetical protein
MTATKKSLDDYKSDYPYCSCGDLLMNRLRPVYEGKLTVKNMIGFFGADDREFYMEIGKIFKQISAELEAVK